MATVGVYIEGDNLCTHCASSVLTGYGLTFEEVQEALHDGWSKVNVWPLRYNGKITDCTVYYSEYNEQYTVTPYKNFTLSHPELKYYSLDVKEASTRTFSEEGLDPLCKNELIYVAIIDDKLTIVDENYKDENGVEATYIIRENYELTNEDRAIIRAIVEDNNRDGIFCYDDNNNEGDLEGMMCDKGTSCDNPNKDKDGVYWIFEPYTLECQCSGCDSCTKPTDRINNLGCSLEVARGEIADVAEKEYGSEFQLCLDCEAAMLKSIDDLVFEYIDLLWWSSDEDGKKYLDGVNTAITQYGSFNGYDQIAHGLTVYEECNGTLKAKIVQKIEELYKNAEIDLSEITFTEYVTKLENDYSLLDREKSRQYNERVEKYSKQHCDCPVHASAKVR